MLVRSVAAIELVHISIEAGTPPAAAVELAASVRDGAASAAVDGFIERLWPFRETLDLAQVLSRGRLLPAQPVASRVVHELGVALARPAEMEDTDELTALIDRVALRQIRCLPPPRR